MCMAIEIKQYPLLTSHASVAFVRLVVNILPNGELCASMQHVARYLQHVAPKMQHFATCETNRGERNLENSLHRQQKSPKAVQHCNKSVFFLRWPPSGGVSQVIRAGHRLPTATGGLDVRFAARRTYPIVAPTTTAKTALVINATGMA